MASLIWWKERLREGSPLWSEALRLDRINLRKPMERDWPSAVARGALYQDYENWFNIEFLSPYKDARTEKLDLPKPDDQLTFFATLGPVIYLAGKEKQVKVCQVPVPAHHEGRWVTVKKSRYFIRLFSLDTHIAAYETVTGNRVHTPSEAFNKQRAEIIAQQVRDYLSRNPSLDETD